MWYTTCHCTTTMECNKPHKNDIEPNRDQRMPGPHHHDHHGSSSTRQVPHEGEREEPSELNNSPYPSLQWRRSCSVAQIEHNASGKDLAWQFHNEFKIIVHSTDCPQCKAYAQHFGYGLLEQDTSHWHMHEVLHAHILASNHEPSGSATCKSRRFWDHNLKHKLSMCREENNNLRCQVRLYHTELDSMRHRESNDHYDCCKQRCTSTKMTLSSSGGYVWPQADLPQVVVSPLHSPTPLPQAQSPVAPMEVNNSVWVPLLQPGESNQPNTTRPWLPLVPMHLTLGECNTAYPTIPRGLHYSRVDNTIHMGAAAATAAQRNEAVGIVLPHNTMPPSYCRFP